MKTHSSLPTTLSLTRGQLQAVILLQEHPSVFVWKSLSVCPGNSQARPSVQFGMSHSAGFCRAHCPVRRLWPCYCILFSTLITLDVPKGLTRLSYRKQINKSLSPPGPGQPSSCIQLHRDFTATALEFAWIHCPVVNSGLQGGW